MKEFPEHIALKFNCQENPESMTKTANGDFCSTCQKEVIDFTTMSTSEIQRIRQSQSEMCGKFRIEQIEPGLRPIEAPKVRSLAFLSTLILSLNINSVSAQSTVDPKVEQSQGTSNAPNLTPEEAKEQSENGQHISMSKAAPTESEEEVTEHEQSPQKTKRYKKWFWSKRFPFLHRKRRHWRGKF